MADDVVSECKARLREGAAAEARDRLVAHVREHPTDAGALRLLSVAHQHLGQREAALDAARSARVVAPDDVDVLYQLGQAHFGVGQRDEAQEAWERVVTLQPSFAPAWTNLGRLHDERFRHEEALACYERALALDDQHPIPHTNRGNSLLALERFAEALSAYDAALKVAGGHVPALMGRQTALVEMGQLEAARAVPVQGTPADRGEVCEHVQPRLGGDLVLRWVTGRHPHPHLLKAEAEALGRRVSAALDAGATVDRPIEVGLAPVTLRAAGERLVVCIPDVHRDPLRHRTGLVSPYLQGMVMAGMLGARVKQPPSPVGWLQSLEIPPDVFDQQRVVMRRVPPVDPHDSGWRASGARPSQLPPARLPISLLLKIRPSLSSCLSLPTAWTAAYDGERMVSARDASGAERLASTGPART